MLLVASLPTSSSAPAVGAVAPSAAVEVRTARRETSFLFSEPEDALERAAQLMAEHDVTHLVVVQPHSGQPVGIVSALDVAGALAWAGTD
jgi:CBS domain-containing protein